MSSNKNRKVPYKKKFKKNSPPSSDICDYKNRHRPFDRILAVQNATFFVEATELAAFSTFFAEVFGKNQKIVVEVEDVIPAEFHNFLRAPHPDFAITNLNILTLMELSIRLGSTVIHNKCLKFLGDETNFKQFRQADLLELCKHDISGRIKEAVESSILDELRVCNSWPKKIQLLKIAYDHDFENLKIVIEEHFVDKCQSAQDDKKSWFLKLVNRHECLRRTKVMLEQFFIIELESSDDERKLSFITTAQQYNLKHVERFIEMYFIESFSKDEDKGTNMANYLKISRDYNLATLKDNLELHLIELFKVCRSVRPLILAFNFGLEKYKRHVAESYSSWDPSERNNEENLNRIADFPEEIQQFLFNAVLANLSLKEK